jgi:hypothetical protein
MTVYKGGSLKYLLKCGECGAFVVTGIGSAIYGENSADLMEPGLGQQIHPEDDQEEEADEAESEDAGGFDVSETT